MFISRLKITIIKASLKSFRMFFSQTYKKLFLKKKNYYKYLIALKTPLKSKTISVNLEILYFTQNYFTQYHLKVLYQFYFQHIQCNIYFLFLKSFFSIFPFCFLLSTHSPFNSQLKYNNKTNKKYVIEIYGVTVKEYLGFKY